MRPSNMDHLTNKQLAGALNDIIEHNSAIDDADRNLLLKAAAKRLSETPTKEAR